MNIKGKDINEIGEAEEVEETAFGRPRERSGGPPLF
jgi:hypothetical protein